jgi:hypothetical protein
VRPLRPEERRPRIQGRVYALGDETRSGDGERASHSYRVGTSLQIHNIAGRGGDLHLDAEANDRRTRVPDLDDDRERHLRLDRLSYAWGGHRFASERQEVGRFLQQAMPEFGVLDGYEYGQRLGGGHRFAASIGFMPELDVDYATGSDFQVAGSWRWVSDATEVLSASAGYQKTFHDGAADRDLLVARFHWLPRRGWNLNGSAWVDLYTPSDDAKGAGLGLTQAYLRAGRRFEGGSSLDLTYGHLEFPEIERFEFTPVAEDQLARDHNDRVALRSRLVTGATSALRGELGAWIDEDEHGGDVLLGLERRGIVDGAAELDLEVFATRGQFSTLLGSRAVLDVLAPGGRYSFSYELSNHHLDGFEDGNDDIPQHRLRASRDYVSPPSSGGWGLSAYLEGDVFHDELAATAGFYIQKSF